MSRSEDEDESAPQTAPKPSEAAETASASAKPSDPPDAARELRNAVFSLKNAAGALFGNMQPAIKEVLNEADRVYQQAKASARPAVSGVAEEATRMVKQIGETAEPLARSVGGELHRFSEVMADAVDGVFKGTLGAVSAACSAVDPAHTAGASEQERTTSEPEAPTTPSSSGRDDD